MEIFCHRYFDLRKSSSEFEWDHLGQGRYLRDFAIKKDIERPISLDAISWSKLNLDAVGNTAESQELWKLSVGPPPNHWESFEEFVSAVLNLLDEVQREATVLIIDDIDPQDPAPLSPLPISARILGFDVADREMWVSGLMNCGYLEEDWAEFDLEKYVPYLNQWHLFDELEPAREFAKMSDLRVTEHAPFSVFRLATVDVHSLRA